MAFTELRKINGKKYYYRVISVRKGNKVTKKRKYLRLNLSSENLLIKEEEADKELLKDKNKKINKNFITSLEKNASLYLFQPLQFSALLL